jgi:predicted nucleotidyltransferase
VRAAPELAPGGVIGYNVTMRRAEAIRRLRGEADALKALGATSLYLFGSVGRDDAGTRSDLDLFLDYDPAQKFSLIDLVDIKLFLEDTLAVEVDVTTRDSLHPMLRDDIEKSAIRVF